MAITEKRGRCVNCKIDTRFILHLQLFANGSENFLWVCSRCNRRNPGRDREHFIAVEKVKAHLSEAEVLALPKLFPSYEGRCLRCGRRDVELHHWAPKGIFGVDEAEQWPKDWLCRLCHEEWHARVTPWLIE